MLPGLAITGFDAERDADELVRMWRASFEHGVGVVDPHPLSEQRAFLVEQLAHSHQLVVVRDAHGIAAFLASTPEEIAQLYVRTDLIGHGIGSRLLQRAKDESNGSLWLYTFRRNHPARAFYIHRGFVEVAYGVEPDWQLEDVRLEWRRDPERVSAGTATTARPG